MQLTNNTKKRGRRRNKRSIGFALKKAKLSEDFQRKEQENLSQLDKAPIILPKFSFDKAQVCSSSEDKDCSQSLESETSETEEKFNENMKMQDKLFDYYSTLKPSDLVQKIQND